MWGAERWIKSHPGRLFLDRKCSEPFPLDVPGLATARFHRVVVAHNASQRCRDELGGSGSLMLMPHIIGPMHSDPRTGGIVPFAIGQIDPDKGYVHVLDDTTLDILLGNLDTVRDFVSYLTKKEEFVTSGLLLAATGEEDLLGYYLRNLNDRKEHDFIFPGDANAVVIDAGIWEDFERSPERRLQLEANRISYTWDRIIEKFAHNILGGTSLYHSHPRIADQLVPLRFMAREGRTRRRMLSTLLVDFLEKTPTREMRATRIVKPSNLGDPYYVFLLLSVPDDKLIEKYREVRRLLLEDLCMATKLQFPDALDIVGFATEPGLKDWKTEDVNYLDARDWTPELQAQAEEMREDLKLLKQLRVSQRQFQEYPKPPPAEYPPDRHNRKRPQSLRNSVCPCGSGKKFKQCCGR